MLLVAYFYIQVFFCFQSGLIWIVQLNIIGNELAIDLKYIYIAEYFTKLFYCL